MSFYNVCPKCGAHLDPAEKCECESAEQKQEKVFEQYTVSPATGQVMFYWAGKSGMTR
ncbi:MAG: hypothetical protein HFE60_07985 [Anaerotignum sp.]|nr:hypothetical protein [Anaerotignum sp.]